MRACCEHRYGSPDLADRRIAIVGLGLLLLSAVFDPDTSTGLFALGSIALCVGAGFIVSAAV